MRLLVPRLFGRKTVGVALIMAVAFGVLWGRERSAAPFGGANTLARAAAQALPSRRPCRSKIVERRAGQAMRRPIDC